MSGEVAKLAKPNLRGLLNKQIGVNLGITLGLVVVICTAVKLIVHDPKKRAYAEYYRKLDNNALFNQMRAAGVFSAVPKK
ncbi:cytochrome c oxidase subunit 6C-1-like [Chrysoperla carnea]|uniref:cytochrome c oxidase subunit 6C-1-like n=1 Tax=Chrysoperla carnea TaxID=189513 RepID=UPI001D07AF73|nr:cytochrome c oxidase subunit 6C-1-like [Chrysoperla carnea]